MDPAIAFVNGRSRVSIEQAELERRVVELQTEGRKMPRQFGYWSPAALQLVVLEPTDRVRTDLLKASNLLSERRAYALGNRFQREYPAFYSIFETQAVLTLSALRKDRPLTHWLCDRVRDILDAPLVAEVTAAERRLQAAAKVERGAMAPPDALAQYRRVLEDVAPLVDRVIEALLVVPKTEKLPLGPEEPEPEAAQAELAGEPTDEPVGEGDLPD